MGYNEAKKEKLALNNKLEERRLEKLFYKNDIISLESFEKLSTKTKKKKTKGGLELNFQKHIEEYLAIKGHNILKQDKSFYSTYNYQLIDIASIYDNIIYLTEVKIMIECQALQTAIGQLIIHQFTNKDSNLKYIYQIGLPYEYLETNNISKELENFLNSLNIKILYVHPIKFIP
jgi:hypothetical protein